MTAARLIMWTVYDHPDDFPDKFVARRFEIHDGVPWPTSDVRSADSIGDLRDDFARAGLICLRRDRTDNPVIVETWL